MSEAYLTLSHLSILSSLYRYVHIHFTLSFLSKKTQDDVIIDKYQLLTVGKMEDDNGENTNANPIPHPPVVVSLNGVESEENPLRVGIFIEVDPEQLEVTSYDVTFGKFGSNECPKDSYPVSSLAMCKMVFNLTILDKLSKHLTDQGYVFSLLAKSDQFDTALDTAAQETYPKGCNVDVTTITYSPTLSISLGKFTFNPSSGKETPSSFPICLSITQRTVHEFRWELSINCRDESTIKASTIPNSYTGMSVVEYNNVYEATVDEDCYPHTSNGAVVKVDFTIDELADVSTPGDNGHTLKFCIRMGYKQTEIDMKKTWINYLDTQIAGTVNTEGIFSTFDQDIVVTKNKVNDFTTAVTKQIKVKAFLCNNQYDNVDESKQYQVGQYARICVRVHAEGSDYYVAGFETVSCGIRDNLRVLITGGNIKNNDLTQVLAAKNTIQFNNMIAMKTVLLASWLGDEEDEVTCTGKVELKQCDNERTKCASMPTRRVQEEKEIRSEEKELRTLEDTADAAATAELYESPFEMKIYMDTPNNNNKNNIFDSSVPQLPSSAPPPTTGTTVVFLGFGSLFFLFVVSFFL